MNIKRLLGCILAACMVFNTSVVAYAASATVLQGDTDSASDVEEFENN